MEKMICGSRNSHNHSQVAGWERGFIVNVFHSWLPTCSAFIKWIPWSSRESFSPIPRLQKLGHKSQPGLSEREH